jgi:hypothetical protein
MDNNNKAIGKLPWWGVYALLAMALVPSYIFTRQEMIGYEGYYISVFAPLTFNIVLLFGLWGFASDRMGKGKPWWYGWGICLAGFIALVLFFRFAGGIPTILG